MCLEAWEAIVKKQQEVTGNNQYTAFFRLNKGYLIHLNDHILIRACLILIAISENPEQEYFDILKDKGYNIDTSSQEAINNSIDAGLHKCDNLITKATSKRKEIDTILKQSDTGEAMGFEGVIANLNYNLGFNVDENITLSRFNEYQKIIKARNKPAEKENVRNRKR